jgi:hypothetical protein
MHLRTGIGDGPNCFYKLIQRTTEYGYSMLSLFTNLIMDSNVVCLSVCLFSFLLKIWMTQKQYLIIKQQI